MNKKHDRFISKKTTEDQSEENEFQRAQSLKQENCGTEQKQKNKRDDKEQTHPF